MSSFLREEMALSAGLVNRLKWQGKILVNGKPEFTNYPVKIGDIVAVLLEADQIEYPAEDGELTVLYEDADILAVDKPAGMLIHPSRSKNSGTLANFVAGYYRKTGQSCAFHPLTRLDRDTFGVVLLAKNAHIHHLLQESPIQKVYHGVVFGQPEQPAGVVDAPIARRPLPSLLRYVHPEGKTSVTEYRVLGRKEMLCKLELRPVTGRTHQLRVHCAYMGCPILGDPQYGTGQSKEESEKMGLKSQLLCAKKLVFPHPITGQTITVESQMDVSW